MGKNKKEKKVIYYSDPLHDDFAGTNIKTVDVGSDFVYIHGRFWRFCSTVLYYIVLPIVSFLEFCFSGVRIVGRKNARRIKGGFFMYGNHTSFFDAYAPAVMVGPKRAHVIASADSVSIRGLGTVVQMLGGIPIPNSFGGMKNFVDALEYYYRKGRMIAVYPEAHIWPYYTGVRPFESTSFRYPVKFNSPVIACFTAYSQPRGLSKLYRKSKKTIYVSEPIYPDTSLPLKDAQQKLRDEVYEYMKKISEKYSTNSLIEYVYVPKPSETEEIVSEQREPSYAVQRAD